MVSPPGGCADTAIALPVLASSHHAPSVRPSRSTRKRFLVLFAVQLLMIIHVIQWLWTGHTLSPVEPSESMQTVKDGVINAGTILFSIALLSTLVLGRWFCGWGCHVLLLQDGCAWLLKKAGIRPRPFRSRLLLLLPLALALYMFVWPIAYRWAIAPYLRPDLTWPGLSVHLFTGDFWQSFPGLMIAVPFFLVCGGLTVYFLGQKGFCTYACPYGGFFAPLDRVSPFRIRVTDDCEHCGHCTAVCTSNVRVHEEVAQFGMVVDPGCMKCMDCVSVCPNDALYVGMGRPAFMAVADPDAVVGPPGHRHPIPDHAPELSRWEEILALGVALFTLFSLNATFAPDGGLKVSLPLLFAGGCAIIVVFLCWKSLRIIRRANEGFHGLVLRQRGRISATGWSWLALTALAMTVTTMLGLQNGALAIAERLHQRVNLPPGAVFTHDAVAPPPQLLARARMADRLYELASLVGQGGVGFVPSVQTMIDIRRAWLAAVERDFVACEALLLAAWSRIDPDDPKLQDFASMLATDIARARWAQYRVDEMEGWYDEQLAAHPTWEGVHRDRVALAMTDDDNPRAIHAARAWSKGNPQSLEAMRRLSLLLVERGDTSEVDEGIALIHRTLEIEPNNPGAWRAIAIGHARMERLAETEAALRHATELAPDDWRYWQALGEFLQGSGRAEEAKLPLDRATRAREAEMEQSRQ